MEKQLRELDAIEAEFCGELTRRLRACAAGSHSMLFYASPLRPEDYPPSFRSETTDELFDEAERILKLRARYGLATVSCLAASYVEACHRAVDREDHHRPGARNQARQLLESFGHEP